ncbi:hypothetical protein [Pontibacter pudoricolor]|uniref:hypothetical protein n=1 Tax=Pontibacter pudoricolor TaxID=2694930 RepID=UPI001390927E|nr:hypothetical protein [Pontibacter pudoricolor]
MKNLLLAISLLFYSCSQQAGERTYTVEYTGDFKEYKGVDTLSTYLVDRYIIDLDYDGKADTIVLENLEDLKGDPQLFTIMKVKLASNKEYVYKNVQGALIDKETKLKLQNRLQSDKLYIPETTGQNSLVFVWDYQYPDCTARLAIYQIDKSGISEKVNQDFYALEIAEMEKGKSVVVIGKPDCEEETATDSIRVSL